MKIGVTKDDEIINTDAKAQLKGITEASIPTYGVCKGKIKIDNEIIEHPFQIVGNNFPLMCDGILGKDFFYKYGCTINYKEKCLSFKFNNKDYNIDLVSSKLNPIKIPARSQIIKKIKISLNTQEASPSNTYLCKSKQISEGLFIGNAIIAPNNGITYTTFVNSNLENVNLEDINLDTEPIENFEIYTVSHKNVNYENLNNEDRIKTILNNIELDHMSTEERESIINICSEYNDLFYLDGDILSHTDAVTHPIPTTDSVPVNIKPYRLPFHQKLEVQNQVDKMLNDEIIVPSNSPWNFPLIVVPKKPDKNGNKRWRVVVDFRKLNDKTIGDAYPLPNITDILDQLGNSKFYSTLDLANGFHQILTSEKDRAKTAFSTPLGHYEYKRMPYGLKTAPSTFQRLMDNCLLGLQNLTCFVYMDDIVIYGKTLDDHNLKLKDIFSRLRKYNLKLQPQKCQFLQKSLAYLGHVISNEGISPDPRKVQSIENFPKPKCPKDVKSFLGLTGYYRKFIKNFAKIAQPLNNLLKKDTPFIWNPLCTRAFEELKEKLINPPILQYPDFSREFILTTDASGVGISGILSQGNIGSDLPIAYGSRSLSKSEKNYSTVQLEALAVVHFTCYFRPYLFGRRFKIVTDHKPLQYLFNSKDTNSMLTRWRIKLSDYDYEIIYKKGTENTNADALSRMYKMTLRSDSNNYYNKNKLINEFSYTNYINNLGKGIIINKNIVEVTDRNVLDNSDASVLIIFTNKDLNCNNELINKLEKTMPHINNVKSRISSPPCFISLDLLNNKKVLYFITHDTDRLNYEQLYNLFLQLKQYILNNNLDHVCFENPFKSTSGYYHLKYDNIRPMLRFIFDKTNTKVEIFDPPINNDLTDEEINKILHEFHNSPTGGHKGVSKTYRKIKQYHKWPKMFEQIKNFVKSCEVCQKNKSCRIPKQPMQITTTANKPFEKVSLDIYGPLPVTQSGNKYLLTFIDDLTKFSQAIPIENQEASTIAENFVRHIILKFGCPKIVLTDQGQNFLSQLFKDVCKLLRIHKIQTTSYRPQSNGSLERSHRNLTEYLRAYINKSQDDWDSWIDYAIFSYNTAIHSATNFTPHELLYGNRVELPSSVTKSPEICYNYGNYANELKSRLQHSHAIARDNLLKSKEKSKAYYDNDSKNTKFNIGDKVLLRDDASHKGKCKKLMPVFTGPYEIIEINSNVNVTILKNKKYVKVHINRIKLFVD